MGTTERDILVEIPRDDGGIGAALADLETRIAAWTSAIGQIHQTLATGAVRTAGGSAPAPAAEASKTPSVVELPPSGRSSAPPAPKGVPAEGVPADPKLRAGKIKKLISSSGGTTNPDDLDRFAFKGETPPEPPKPAAVDEDEALLASLDPKRAREIRIKRRLCNNKKSVRELLDES